MSLSTDPRDLLLDDDNDLVIDTDMQFARGLLGVAQDIRTALQMVTGEWFLNLDAGIPLFDKILDQPETVARINARVAIQNAILGVADVISLKQFSIDFNPTNRTLSVTFIAQTAFGDTPVETQDFQQAA